MRWSAVMRMSGSSILRCIQEFWCNAEGSDIIVLT